MKLIMNKKVLAFITLFLLITTGLTGCKKDPNNDNIIGKWKLVEVTYYDSSVTNENGNHPALKIDCSKNNIIYNFQENKKLIISNSIIGKLHKNKHSYKYHSRSPEAHVLEGNLQIEKTKFYCSVFETTGTMTLNGNKDKVLDEFDVMMLMKDNIYSWHKTFVKLN